MDAGPERIRVLVADDHEIVRGGIRALLATEPAVEVCGEAATGRDAVAKARRLRPDVAIVDVAMPELNGFETTRRIRDVAPACEVLVFTFHDTEQVARDALEAGAHGYVLKSHDARALVTAVKSLAEHKPFFTSPASDLLLEGYLGRDGTERCDHTGSRLTSRQREVLQLLAEGRTNKDIAQLLDITVKTVETHRMNLMSRLGFHSVGDLIRYALRENLVEP